MLEVVQWIGYTSVAHFLFYTLEYSGKYLHMLSVKEYRVIRQF